MLSGYFKDYVEASFTAADSLDKNSNFTLQNMGVAHLPLRRSDEFVCYCLTLAGFLCVCVIV